jgi:hypothetical protein
MTRCDPRIHPRPGLRPRDERRVSAQAARLRLGEAVAANLTAIIGGILVFRDPIGTGPVAISGRMIAFALVVAGAALIPAPVRAARRPAHE